jgi:hypothetical protein
LLLLLLLLLLPLYPYTPIPPYAPQEDARSDRGSNGGGSNGGGGGAASPGPPLTPLLTASPAPSPKNRGPSPGAGAGGSSAGCGGGGGSGASSGGGDLPGDRDRDRDRDRDELSLPGGMLPSHLVQWIDGLALVRLFTRGDYAGVGLRDAAVRARRGRDRPSYVAAALLASIACSEGRLEEAARLGVYAVRVGTSRDMVHPAACLVLFLAGHAALATMEALAGKHAHVSLLLDEGECDSGSEGEGEGEEGEETDTATPTATAAAAAAAGRPPAANEFDGIAHSTCLRVDAHRRAFRLLHRAALAVIAALGRLDAAVFPGLPLLRFVLIARKSRLWRSRSLREFLVSYDHTIAAAPPQFLLGLAFAQEERERVCAQLCVSSETKPCPAARR